MRISCDMDGVLADMDSSLARLAAREFGVGGTGAARGAPPEDAPAQEGDAEGAPDEARPSSAILERLSARQQNRLWQRVAETKNFWESLAELEPGTVRRMQELSHQLRWDILFVTQRPSTAGRTTQLQTQRWLHKHGFDLPAVYTTKGSRGRIAAALTLDVHIDDRIDNAVDVATESRAWSILVWRDAESFERVEANAKKLNIGVVRTVAEALEKIVAADKSGPSAARGAAADAGSSSPALTERLKRAFGFRG
jgi:hypothetical protein